MNADEFTRILQNKTKIPIKIIVVAVAAIVAIAVGVLMLVGISAPGLGRGSVKTMTESSLQQVLQISELQTVDYTYNAIAKAPTEDGMAIKYYVAYEGNVKAGIDFSKIEVNVDEENKTITISVPNVEIQGCSVNAGKLDFIFVKEKYNKTEVAAEAYEVSLKDLEKRIESETDLLDLAEENAVSAVKGLIEPWVNQVKDEYSVEVKAVH